MSVEGRLYGIPESLKAVALYYNKELLPTPPTTTDELKALIESDTPASVSIGCYHHWGFYGAFGGQVFDENWKVIADQGTGMVDAYTYLQSLYQTMVAKGLPKNDGEAAAPFREGKIATTTNGNWALGDYKAALGDKLGVVPLPAGPAGPANPLLGVDGFYFNPNSQNLEAALKVALYLTNADAQTAMMNGAGHVPARSDVAITDPLVQGFADAFATAYVRPQVPQLGLYWSNFCGDGEMFEGKVSPADFVATATANANK